MDDATRLNARDRRNINEFLDDLLARHTSEDLSTERAKGVLLALIEAQHRGGIDEARAWFEEGRTPYAGG